MRLVRTKEAVRLTVRLTVKLTVKLADSQPDSQAFLSHYKTNVSKILILCCICVRDIIHFFGKLIKPKMSGWVMISC